MLNFGASHHKRHLLIQLFQMRLLCFQQPPLHTKRSVDMQNLFMTRGQKTTFFGQKYLDHFDNVRSPAAPPPFGHLKQERGLSKRRVL